jgi:hypothetical protein
MEGHRKTLSRLEFNHLCLAIQAHLTLDIRKAVLVSRGFPPGTVSTYTRDNTAFWAWLDVQMLFSPDNLNPSLWEDYPEVLKLVQEKMK